MTIDQAIIDAIPRHPADPMIAYGYDLDQKQILELVKNRTLNGAIFRGLVSRKEIETNVSASLTSGFRRACEHFTGFFVSYEKGHKADVDSGISVMRGIGMPNNQGMNIDVGRQYEGNKTLEDFLKSSWLTSQIDKLGSMVALPFKGYGYHVFHAPAEKTKEGYAADWHTHEDIGAHITYQGAGLEWLPSHISTADAKSNPQKYEAQVQEVEIGDLMILGRVTHRSSHKIPQLGQFAVITHGPYEIYGND